MALAGAGTHLCAEAPGIYTQAPRQVRTLLTESTVRLPEEAETRFSEADSAQPPRLRLPSVPASDHRGGN